MRLRARRDAARHRGGGAHAPRAADGPGATREQTARSRAVRWMRVWVDLTNSPHVLVMRPLIEAMRADGHEVRGHRARLRADARAVERFGIEHTAIGHHRGGRLAAKGVGPRRAGAARSRAGRAGAGSTSRSGTGRTTSRVAAALLGIPRPRVRLRVRDGPAHGQLPALPGRGGARRHPARAARPLRREAGKLRRYAGLKEEYYLADFEPTEAVLGELGLDREQPLVVVRTPPEVSLYHRFENPLFAGARAPARGGAGGGAAAHRRAARRARARRRLRGARARGGRASRSSRSPTS